MCLASNPQFSIILPVYNSCDTLESCIDSILNQKVVDFELIIVDDGSIDGSEKICDRYLQKDRRIRVYHTENKGVSAARNLGLSYSRGNWITFCDSDDYVLPEWLENYEINNNEYSLIVQGFETDGPISGENISGEYRYGLSFIGSSHKGQILLYKENCFGYLWVKAFKKSIIDYNKLKFKTFLKKDEDQDFIIQYLKHCEKVRFTDQIGYHYNVPNWGAKYSKTDHFLDFVKLYKEEKKLIGTNIKGNSVNGYGMILEAILFNSLFMQQDVAIERIYIYKSLLRKDVFKGNISIISKVIIYFSNADKAYCLLKAKAEGGIKGLVKKLLKI